jgi:cephalosporin-C deacetylase
MFFHNLLFVKGNIGAVTGQELPQADQNRYLRFSISNMTNRILILFLLLQVFLVSNGQPSPAPVKLVDVVLAPDHPDWNYKLSEPGTVNVTVLRYGIPVKNVPITFEAGPELFPADQKGKLMLENGTGKISAGTAASPGFRQLTVKAEVNGRTYTGEVKLGFAPEKILPTVAMPAGFNQFWTAALAENAKVPMDARVTPQPQRSTPDVDVYLVNLQNFRRGQRLYGYLCKPKAAGKFPVLLEPPGAGIKRISPNTALASRGFIVFTTEIHGISPEVDAETYANISSSFGDYPTIGLDDKDTYYYKKVYLGCVRAIDYLCGLPEFDGKNVLVTGGSQGGALTIVTAALDKRVTAIAAFYPALSDHTGYLSGRAGGWPHLLRGSNALLNNSAGKLSTLQYYDVVNFARSLTVPGFYSWGYNDNTTPPTSVFAAVNTIRSPKTIVITPISAHWRFGETNEESISWLKSQVRK